ncbi:MAG: MBL fold metallo-hydrolase [Verrucomicrobiales bacterium]|nr:MBL fold metallo-hydrolase [Verrucomicrobiales bacterium]
MRITLHGAAGEVTGSAYLVETEQARILVDFGMFQGGARLEARNVRPAGLSPKRLDAVLVTHAHLDHVGRLPLLLKGGYPGAIHATDATRDLAGLILRDSAKVQSYDVARQNRKRERAGKPPVKPLYDAGEVEETLERFREVEFGRVFSPARGVTARYAIAGHMLGSASIQLSVQEGGKTKTVVFSGDLGPAHLAIVRDAVPFEHADLVFLESTYGDRDNKPLPETLAEFRAIIQEAVRRRSRILVPAFAVGRTQQLLYHLDELFCAGKVKRFPVFLDSPMAIEATRIYRRHPDLFDAEARAMERARAADRRPRHVQPTPTAEDSMKLNDVPGPCLIMAGSGMCNAGRILHHLKHGLWQSDTVVMIVGYQSEGTLGRRLVDGDKSVRIFGERVAVKAGIHTLNGFSAHAGQTALLAWFGHLAPSRPRWC